MADSREREEADFYSMFLFSFTYQGELHWATCNESNLENNLEESPSSSLEELASFSIESNLREKSIWKDGISVKDVKIFHVDASDMEKFSLELEKYLVSSLDILKFKIPVSTL